MRWRGSLRSEVAASAALLSGGVGRSGLNRPATTVQAFGLSEARAFRRCVTLVLVNASRIPSNAPEAFQCKCGYDLRSLPTVNGNIRCPECDRETTFDHLGTVRATVSIWTSACVLCGPTLGFALLSLGAVAVGDALEGFAGHFFIAGLGAAVLVPLVAAPLLVRGRLDCRARIHRTVL